MSLTDHLAGLDVEHLAALMEHRPDVLVEPAPRSVDELAQRLDGADSLSLALPVMTRDQVVTAQVVAALGTPELPVLAARLRAPEPYVRSVVDELCARGLAWIDGHRVGLPDRLADHFAADVARFRPLALIGRQSRVDELRTAVAGLGADPGGLRKPELIERLAALVADPQTVATAVAELAAPARRRLADILDPAPLFGGFGRRSDDPDAPLVRAGLLIESQYARPELPREVAVELRFGGRDQLTGRPELAESDDPSDDGRAGADGALLALTTMLDEAVERPLARLKKGGIGARERARLAKRLNVTDPSLWIDVAYSGGLLASSAQGYPAAAGYDRWREEEPATRWARIAVAWFELDLAPTSREIEDGEVAPPLLLESAAGMLRRSLLRAAGGGRSVRAAVDHLDWFCPLHPYDRTGRARKVDAAVHEAALLGIVVGDRLTALGEHLVEVAAHPDPAPELARRCAELLPRTRGMLVLQSDLTAVVSGQPDVAAARVLAAAAVSESRGVAATWRFTPASVRGALDAGWTADALRAEFAEVSGRELPQPLDYLVTDVARRHGAVRVRHSCTCVTGSESDIAEIAHTRSLGALQLRRLAPTVLTSPLELDDVLARLRAAGFAPMPEDAEGVVIVPERATAPASGRQERRPRKRVVASDLAARLLAAGTAPARPASVTHRRLAGLAPRLNPAEVALLADALDHRRDVRIVYRNKAGNRTVRDVRPQELYGRSLSSWCHLRSGEREFSLDGIESVSPVG
ncbi:MAG: helicase-associated domain-containing protein [Pseudonocardia sp.]|nr:helicase-associated domain-containing protein [Pseudonocardia sp.]